MADWISPGIVVAVFVVLIALMLRRQWRHGGSRWGVHGEHAKFEAPPDEPWFKDGLGGP
jgi:hypothetical protein